jgi:hypothetical protein
MTSNDFGRNSLFFNEAVMKGNVLPVSLMKGNVLPEQIIDISLSVGMDR